MATVRKIEVLSENFKVVGICTSKEKEFYSFMYSYLVASTFGLKYLNDIIMSYLDVPVFSMNASNTNNEIHSL
jgi:hypothetical protein